LRKHAVAHAARALRESGVTPAQVKVGIKLALGKTKPVIADELGLQLSSVADLTKKLYQNLDIHNSAELGAKIWLNQARHEEPQNLRRTGVSSGPLPGQLRAPRSLFLACERRPSARASSQCL
jgi:DNA-binding CsgD family transcriptional regulator